MMRTPLFEKRDAAQACAVHDENEEVRWWEEDGISYGFLKMGVPNSWMVCKEKSKHKIDDLGVPPILGSLHMGQKRVRHGLKW